MLEGHLSFIIKYGRHSCNTDGDAIQEVKNRAGPGQEKAYLRG